MIWSKDISTVKANLYEGDSFLKGRPNFTEDAHSTEKAHFYGGDPAWHGWLSSSEEINPYRRHLLLRRLISTKEAHFYAGDWFSRRMLILTGVTHFHREHIFYGGDSFPRKHSFLRNRLVSKAEINEWVASNRVLVFAQRFLGSPQGEHYNSPENGRFDHLYVHIFCKISRDLPFLDKILQRVRGEKRQLKSCYSRKWTCHCLFNFQMRHFSEA